MLLQDKLHAHSRFSLYIFRYRNWSHFSLWSQIQTIFLYHPTSSCVWIYIPEVMLQNIIQSSCSLHPCAPSSPHSFGVTGIAPNCHFLALTISSCGEISPLPYEVILPLKVDQYTLLWMPLVSFLVSQVWYTLVFKRLTHRQSFVTSSAEWSWSHHIHWSCIQHNCPSLPHHHNQITLSLFPWLIYFVIFSETCTFVNTWQTRQPSHLCQIEIHAWVCIDYPTAHRIKYSQQLSPKHLLCVLQSIMF